MLNLKGYQGVTGVDDNIGVQGLGSLQNAAINIPVYSGI